jgi:sugar phosphate isomerase/epimerase
MTTPLTIRKLGTMITYGYPRVPLESELALAKRIGATVLEVLPAWSEYPDPQLLRAQVVDRGLSVHSAHGCWAGQTIKALRVDLGDPDAGAHRESVDDLKRCVDWLLAAGGTYLVVHPGGLSSPADRDARREALCRGLSELADHARGSRGVLCVENMPPGVYPGSRMDELFELLRALDRPELALALDTGHAHIAAEICAETRAAGRLLVTTHVHDNDGCRDSHEPPGHGSIDWTAWAKALDEIGYEGPVMLECVRLLREDPSLFRPEVIDLLTGTRAPGSHGREGL